MSLKIVRNASRKLKSTVMFVASFALVLGSVSTALPFLVFDIAAAAEYSYPSTNSANKAAGNPHVDVVSKGVGTTTLAFVNPKQVTCFEYRTDGDVSQAKSTANYNTAVSDFYPFSCVTSSTTVKTFTARQYVEVRAVFGAERDWDFAWTRFDVLPAPDTTQPTITSPIITNNALWGSDYNILDKSNHLSETTHLPVIGGTVQVGANFNDDMLLTNVVALLPGSGFFVNDANWSGVPTGFHTVTWNTKDTSTWQGVPDGNYIFTFNAKDGGNGQNQSQNSATKEIPVTVDNAGPTVAFTGNTPNENKIVKGIITVEGNFTDANGLMNTDIGIHNDGRNGEGWKCHTDWLTQDTKTCAINTTELNDGTYQLTMAGKDKAGNVTQVFRTIIVDNIAPSVNFISPTPEENAHVHGTITAHVQATDSIGMGSYYIRVWKGAFESGNLVYNGCSSAPGATALGISQDITCSVDTSSWNDGTYIISAQFLDGGSNWGKALRTIYVDNTAPQIESVKVNNITLPTNQYFRATVNITATVKSSETNMESHWFEITGPNDYSKIVTTGLSKGGNSYSFAWDTSGLNGQYSIRYVATDQAGNRNDDPNYSNRYIVTVNLDNTPPGGRLNTIAGKDVSVGKPIVKIANNQLTVEGTAADNQAMNRIGVQLVKVGVSGGLQYVYANNNTLYGKTGPINWVAVFNTSALNLQDGEYLINVSYVDKIGNVSNETELFTLDNTGPVVTIVDITAPITTGSVTPTVTATDDSAPLTYLWTANPTNHAVISFTDNIAQPIFTPTVAGIYSFTLLTTDALGNQTTKTFGFTYTPLVTAATIRAPLARNLAAFATTPAAADDTAVVLGATTTKDAPAVAGAQTSKKVAAAATNNDGNGFGAAWYWLLAIPAAIGAGWWATAAYRRRDI